MSGILSIHSPTSILCVNSLHVRYLASFSLSADFFFKINFFNNSVQEYHQSGKEVGPISVSRCCQA